MGDNDGEFESDSGEESFQPGCYAGKRTFKELLSICAGEGEEEDEEDAVGVMVNESCSLKVDRPTGPKPAKQKGKRVGRKAKWSEACTDDLVEIICNREIYQKNLIFTNVETAKNGGYYEQIIAELKKRCLSREENFPYDIGQTREKFKRCISECKKAALTMKTASGIKRFQEDKGYGKWFNQLLPLVQTRASCQPEQAIEPSSVNRKRKEHSPSPSPVEGSSFSISSSSSVPSTPQNGDEQEEAQPKRMFVPTKMRKRSKKEETTGAVTDLLKKLTQTLENDPTERLIKYFEEENERARQQELRLFSMIFGQQNMAAATSSGFQNHSNAHTQATNMGMNWATGFYPPMMEPRMPATATVPNFHQNPQNVKSQQNEENENTAIYEQLW